jgi:ribonuclease R
MSSRRRGNTNRSAGKKHKNSYTEANNVRQIMNILERNANQGFSVKQLGRKLGVKGKKNQQHLLNSLLDLESRKKIVQIEPTVFQLLRKDQTVVTGKVDFVNPRFAFIVVEGQEKDVKISSSSMNGAVDQDIVRIGVFDKSYGPNPEGEVLEVISRGRDTLVGTIRLNKNYGFVIADSKKIHNDIYIPTGKLKRAEDGQKVIVQITDWPTDERKATGKIIEVLGDAGTNDAEMHSILAEFDLPGAFPLEVEEYAEGISTEIHPKEIVKRRDFREVTTFTIDPVDAKDFDDALSVEFLDNGNYQIGIHIADVSHYMPVKSILEKEAYRRATSVYLVDRVVPMLPEKLSNGLCSLIPNEDKLTFSSVFELTSEGKVVNEWFGRTVIHSDKRYSYEQAQEVILGGEDLFSREIVLLDSLAKILRKNRFNQGSVNFETAEVRFRLDEEGTPIEVVPKVRVDAHKMIEDFMLLANKKVAEFVYNKKKGKEKLTMVYRVHENPDPEKLTDFALFATRFGHNISFDTGSVSHTLNDLTDEIIGKPEENVLQSLAIRAMSKARYATESIGHFGLGFSHYSHFTSPIRRYPDVMVHRLLQHYLDGGKDVEKEWTDEQCVHTSEREKAAAQAERASIKYKQVEFMMNHQNEEFDGIITGITDWGIFVEITETKCEGMIRMSDLTDDYYEFDPKSYTAFGKKNGKKFTLGEGLRVSVKNTNLRDRTMDLNLVEE